MVHVWAEDEALSAINGLWMEADRMLAVTMAGRFVSISSDGDDIAVNGEGLDDVLIIPHWQPGEVSAWQIRFSH